MKCLLLILFLIEFLFFELFEEGAGIFETNFEFELHLLLL